MVIPIETVVNTTLADLDQGSRTTLVTALQRREDEMADEMREIAQRFGMYPEIVAEALADIGVGTPISIEQRHYINQQFQQLMARLQEEYRRAHGDDPPTV